MLNLYDWGSSIATVEPLGAGRIKHINWYFFTDVSPERPKRTDNLPSGRADRAERSRNHHRRSA